MAARPASLPVAFVLCLLAITSLPAQERPPATEPAAELALPSPRDRIEQELERISEIDVVEMPLRDCLLYLTEKHGIPIVLNLKKLDQASISSDTPVTKSLRGIRLAKVLELMLKDLELDYYVDEVLIITTAQDAAAQTETFVYDCQALLDAVRRENSSLPSARLIEIIQSAIQPDSWRTPGFTQAMAATDRGARPKFAPSGTLSEFNGQLIVTQTAKNHRKIAQLINVLRDAAGLEPIAGRPVR